MEAYDALPYFDQEYNFPAVQEEVLRLIEEEMRSFKPPTDNYLSYLPLPDLKFSRSPAFKSEFDRVSEKVKNSTVAEGEVDAYRMENLIDLKRYGVPGAQKGREKDKAQVLSALRNARAQYEHQSCRRLNLQQAEENIQETYEEYAASVETMAAQMQVSVADVNQQRNRVNMERMTSQRAATEHINRVTDKRDRALQRVHQLQGAVEELKAKRARKE
jgi:hypothetical protein